MLSRVLKLNLVDFKPFLICFCFSFTTEPVTEIVGGQDLFINKGSTINLTCIVRYAPEPVPAMVWSHNREVS